MGKFNHAHSVMEYGVSIRGMDEVFRHYTRAEKYDLWCMAKKTIET